MWDNVGPYQGSGSCVAVVSVVSVGLDRVFSFVQEQAPRGGTEGDSEISESKRKKKLALFILQLGESLTDE